MALKLLALICIVMIVIVYGDESSDHCDECTEDIRTYYSSSLSQSWSYGVCGESCINQDSDAIGFYSDYCKCCRGLTRAQCVANGVDSMCGWAYHEGCGYCADWGGTATCGQVTFWEDNYDHCSIDGVTNLDSCSIDTEYHQTNVDSNECDSDAKCGSEIIQCTESEGNTDCDTDFDSMSEYFDQHLNFEAATETDLDNVYNQWLSQVNQTLSSSNRVLLDGIIACAKEKCLQLTFYDIRELNERSSGIWKCVVFVWIIILSVFVVTM